MPDCVARWCSAALVFLLIGLSIAVTIARLRSAMLTGEPDDPASSLTKLVRTQVNTAQYAPLFAILILTLGANSPPFWIEGFMVMAVVARLLFALGMLISPSIAVPNPFRALGAGATYLAGLGLGAGLLVLH